MGMYQPVNYANDFISGMKGMQDILSENKQEARREKESQERTARHGLDMEKGQLELDDKKRTAAADLELVEKTRQYAREKIPLLTNPQEIEANLARVDQIGQLSMQLQALHKDTVDPNTKTGQLVSQPGAAPAEDAAHWKIDSNQFPAVKTFLQLAAQEDPQRFSKVYEDTAEGKTTKYKLDPGSGGGLYYDKDGQLMVEVDSVDLATGQPYGRKPITVNQSNDANDVVKKTTLSDYQTFLGNKRQVYQLALDKGISTHEAADLIIEGYLPVAQKKELIIGRAKDREKRESGMADYTVTQARAAEVKKKTDAELAELTPKLDAVLADATLSSQEKRGKISTMVAAASPETQARLTGSRSMATAMVPGKDELKQVTKYEEGVKGRPGMVREVVQLSDGSVVRGEPFQKHAPKGGRDSAGTDAKVLKEDIAKSSTIYAAKAKAFNKEAAERWPLADDEEKAAIKSRATELEAEKMALETKAEEFFRLTGKKYLPGGVNGGQASPQPSKPAAPTSLKGGKYTAETLPLDDSRVQKAFNAGYTAQQVAEYLNK